MIQVICDSMNLVTHLLTHILIWEFLVLVWQIRGFLKISSSLATLKVRHLDSSRSYKINYRISCHPAPARLESRDAAVPCPCCGDCPSTASLTQPCPSPSPDLEDEACKHFPGIQWAFNERWEFFNKCMYPWWLMQIKKSTEHAVLFIVNQNYSKLS